VPLIWAIANINNKTEKPVPCLSSLSNNPKIGRYSLYYSTKRYEELQPFYRTRFYDSGYPVEFVDESSLRTVVTEQIFEPLRARTGHSARSAGYSEVNITAVTEPRQERNQTMRSSTDREPNVYQGGQKSWRAA